MPLIALAAVPPDAPPMVIMEISLAMGGFSQSGTCDEAGLDRETPEPPSQDPEPYRPQRCPSQPRPRGPRRPGRVSTRARANTARNAHSPKKPRNAHPRKSTPPNPARPLRPQRNNSGGHGSPTSPGAETNATTPTMAAAGSSGLGVGATAGGHGRGAAGGAAGSGSGREAAANPSGFGDAGGRLHPSRAARLSTPGQGAQGTGHGGAHAPSGRARKPDRIDVVDSAGPRLDEAAVKAARASLFAGPKRRGRPAGQSCPSASP